MENNKTHLSYTFSQKKTADQEKKKKNRLIYRKGTILTEACERYGVNQGNVALILLCSGAISSVNQSLRGKMSCETASQPLKCEQPYNTLTTP